MSSYVRIPWVLMVAVVLAACSGQAPGDGNRAPRAAASGIAPAAPHATGHGRAVYTKGRVPRKPVPATPDEDPFDLAPGADAGPATQL